MFEGMSTRRRALLNSLAYTGLVALVAGLAYLTFRATTLRQESADIGRDNDVVPLVELDNLTSRVERSSDSERIGFSLRLRITAPGRLEAQVFVVARNDRVAPKLWGVWPTQGPSGAITTGGHFRSEAQSGERLELTQSWTKITGSIAHPLGAPAYESLMVYVVGPKGEVLLSRPYALPP